MEDLIRDLLLPVVARVLYDLVTWIVRKLRGGPKQ